MCVTNLKGSKSITHNVVLACSSCSANLVGVGQEGTGKKLVAALGSGGHL